MSNRETEVLESIAQAEASIAACEIRIRHDEKLKETFMRQLVNWRAELAAIRKVRGESE